MDALDRISKILDVFNDHILEQIIEHKNKNKELQVKLDEEQNN